MPYPTQTGSDTGTINLIAAGSIDLGSGLAMPDLSTRTTQYIRAGNGTDYANYISPLGVPLPSLTLALHANDSDPVIIAAGQDITAVDTDRNQAASLTLIKPARIEAGNNIYAGTAPGGGVSTTSNGTPTAVKFTFIGQNNSPGDITSIIAGNDFVGGSYALYGPGTFVLQAGRDLGPFATVANGIATIGNGSASGGTFSGLSLKSYLPPQGAEIDLLFGVKPGINYAAAIAQYVDPVNAGAGGIDFLSLITPRINALLGQLASAGKTNQRSATQLELMLELAGLPTVPLTPAGLVDPGFTLNFNLQSIPAWTIFLQASAGASTPSALLVRAMDGLLSQLASAAVTDPQSARVLQLTLGAAGLPPVALNAAGLVDSVPTFSLSPAQTQTIFQAALSSAQQRSWVNGAFLDFLAQVGRDYKDSSSPYFGQNARAYTAISTLFPAGSGYTDNSLSSGGNAAPKVATGKLNVAASLLETQMGGDINIIGPGGGLTVGHTSLDTLTPNQEGILTLAGGTIRAFTDDSILVNQSRIMTQQGGDVDLFVANGDINAGSGPKTYASSPAVSLICTVYGYCYTNPQGLVTGAGIAALVTLPRQDPADSNVTLVAPRGTIDLGSAGVRCNDCTFVAPVVLNSFNIAATGTVTGLAAAPVPNVALTTTTPTSPTERSGQPQQTSPNEQPSIIIVEVVGYGGTGGDSAAPSGGTTPGSSDDDRRRRGQGQ